MSGFAVTANLSGALFDGSAPVRVQQARDDVVRELTELGQDRLMSAFPTGVPVKSGYYRAHISATIAGPAARLDDGGVIYGPWLEGTSSRNETTRFKGYSTFRRAAQWLQDEQVPVVTQTLADRLAQELGG